MLLSIKHVTASIYQVTIYLKQLFVTKRHVERLELEMLMLMERVEGLE